MMKIVNDPIRLPARSAQEVLAAGPRPPVHKVTRVTLFCVFHCLPTSAWAGGYLAEPAGQLVNLVKQPNQNLPNLVAKYSCHPVDTSSRDNNVRYSTSLAAAAQIRSARLRSSQPPAEQLDLAERLQLVYREEEGELLVLLT